MASGASANRILTRLFACMLAREDVTFSQTVCVSVADVTEVPTKCVSSTVTLDINANVLYIDFEGRSDGDSIRRYLTQIKPRQLVSDAPLSLTQTHNSLTRSNTHTHLFVFSREILFHWSKVINVISREKNCHVRACF